MIYILIFFMLSICRWLWIYKFLVKKRNFRLFAMRMEILISIVQVVVGGTLERSTSHIATFGFILVLITIFESMRFRTKI